MTDRSRLDDEHLRRLRAIGLPDRYSYSREAFSRNLGLVSPAEQEQLARSTVAIPGMGGVGGGHLITLVRCGVSRFHLSDFDVFEPGNVNRQYGARIPTFGRSKLATMVEEARSINPFLEITTFPEGIDSGNLDRFLDGVDVVLDSLDFFAFDIRRLLFTRARERGVPVVSVGPIGFSAALLVFLPDAGMSFDRYFDIDDDTDELDRLAAFLVGLTPRTRYLSYMDLRQANTETGRGPSLALACQLCSGVAATEVLRLLLGRNRPLPAPHYAQLDPYLRRYYRGYLLGGNRHPWQRVKRHLVRRTLSRNRAQAQAPPPPVAEVVGAPPSREVTDYLLRAAIQAPSGDNSQPWRFARNGRTVDLFLDRDRDHSFFNVSQLASVIACGAALENMRVAAAGCGLGCHIVPLPSAGDPDHMARLELVDGEAPSDPLHTAIWARHTNRTMYRKAPVPRGAVDRVLEAVAELPGARLHVLDAPPDLRRLARIVRRADLLRVSHRGLHEHFHAMVRRSDREAEATRDGFPLGNLEAGAVGELFLKLSRPWPVMRVLNRIGMGGVFASAAARGLRHCSGAGLLTVPGTTPADFLLGGRALERAWLTFTVLGLDVQPMTAITLFWSRCQLEGDEVFEPRHRDLLRSLWGSYRDLFPAVDFEHDGQVMLFRFGRGRRMSTRTLRRELVSFVDEGVREAVAAGIG